MTEPEMRYGQFQVTFRCGSEEEYDAVTEALMGAADAVLSPDCGEADECAPTCRMEFASAQLYPRGWEDEETR